MKDYIKLNNQLISSLHFYSKLIKLSLADNQKCIKKLLLIRNISVLFYFHGIYLVYILQIPSI